MVLIAAAVTTRAGKTIISRQFVEMSKARIEGLLAAFPKLMSTGKQHTFVETDSVRYMYQPLEKLYMLLITTKASNILEDLETLRLFSRVIPEYCRTMEESEVIDNSFSLIFAFDEIVALGYRENVNLAQIRTFVEMDSHEEKVYQAVRQTQEREAKIKMREKAKELQRQRIEANKQAKTRGSSNYISSSSTGFGNNSVSTTFTPETKNGDDVKSSYVPVQKTPVKGGMKLGGKTRDVDTFVEQLKSEGEKVSVLTTKSQAPAIIQPDKLDVHLTLEEKISAKIGREGGVLAMELLGLLTLRVQNERFGRIVVQLENNDTKGIQLQTHPNVDKELFRVKSQIGLKNAAKPFPLHTDVGVLKYRLQTQDEALLPLLINCWTSENGMGGCDVNIEYDLELLHLDLNDVSIVIPLPIGATPTVNECDGNYTHDTRRNQLTWNIALIDSSNKSGGMEFSCTNSRLGDFFPIQLMFHSRTNYADFKIYEVTTVEDNAPVKFSASTLLTVESYEIV